MIFDKLKNAHKYYCLNPHFEKAFNFLKTTDLENIAAGEYEIDWKNVVVLIQEYTTMSDPPWECHKYHIDLQYLISGIEKVGYRTIEGTKPSGPYKAKTDCYLLEKVEDGNYATLEGDTIILLFPEDAHLPRLVYNKPIPVKKCVIKIII